MVSRLYGALRSQVAPGPSGGRGDAVRPKARHDLRVDPRWTGRSGPESLPEAGQRPALTPARVKRSIRPRATGRQSRQGSGGDLLPTQSHSPGAPARCLMSTEALDSCPRTRADPAWSGRPSSRGVGGMAETPPRRTPGGAVGGWSLRCRLSTDVITKQVMERKFWNWIQMVVTQHKCTKCH